MFFSNESREKQPREWKLVYSPKNLIFEKLLNQAIKSLDINGIVGVKNAEDVEKIVQEKDFLAGVLFDHSDKIRKLPKELSYTLRFPSESRIEFTSFSNWQTDLLFEQFAGGGPRGNDVNNPDEGDAPFYFADGFLSIQDAIARSFIEIKCIESGCKNNGSPIPNVRMQRYPYPPYIKDVLLQGLDNVLAIFIMLSFVYTIISTVRFIAVEKEKQLKEVMKIMGMPVWLHWISWSIRTMIFMIISISCMVGLLKVKKIRLNYSLQSRILISFFFSFQCLTHPSQY